MAGLLFACGYSVSDLLRTQYVSWFSFLHPLVLMLVLGQLVKAPKKQKDK